MRIIAIILAIVLVCVTSFNVKRREFPIVTHLPDDPMHQLLEDLIQDHIDQEQLEQWEEEVAHELESKESEEQELQRNHKKDGLSRRETERADDSAEIPSGDFAVQITPKGTNYTFRRLLESISHDIKRQGPADISTVFLGMNINVKSLRVAKFQLPTMHLKWETAKRLRITAFGGQVKMLGLYTTIYKTTREGQLEATLDDLHITVHANLDSGASTISSIECNQLIGEIRVEVAPTLPSQILETIREIIQQRIDERLCPVIEKHANNLFRRVGKAVHIEDIMDENSYIPFIADPQKAPSDTISTIFTRDSRTGTIVDLPDVQNSDEMIATTLTEEYLNRILTDVNKRGNLAFNMHLVPEIQTALRLSCEMEEKCFGSFVNLKTVEDGSGHLISHSNTAPRLELLPGHALLHMQLTTVLSYKHKETHKRLDYLTVESKLVIRIKDLSFVYDENEEKYQWNGDFSIETMEFPKISTDFEAVKIFASELEDILTEKKSFLEKLLSDNLTGALPVQVNKHLQLSHVHTTFLSRRIRIGADFAMERHLHSNQVDSHKKPTGVFFVAGNFQHTARLLFRRINPVACVNGRFPCETIRIPPLSALLSNEIISSI